jgi:putative transposase
MSLGRPIIGLKITEEQQRELQDMARSRSLPAGLTLRAKIVLSCARGQGTPAVASALGISAQTACKWRERFRAGGMMALCDEVRTGRPRTIREERVAELLQKTLATKPKAGTHWSCRSFALEHGISKSTVQRLWEAFQLAPHRHESFKLSTDAHFVEKVIDVTGLYLSPPDKALVLAVDEKSQCQALERTQPALPMGLGYAEGYTHDYSRHGTTTLFAALDVASGKIISRCKPGHRHSEFIAFLRQIDANTPPDLDLHVIVDNYATHKHPKVKLWLARHPRFHFHFTPTYSSWLNQVEIFFGIITRKAIRRGSFASVKDLIRKIDAFVEAYNRTAKPFAWTATAESIFLKLEKLLSRISGTQH